MQRKLYVKCQLDVISMFTYLYNLLRQHIGIVTVRRRDDVSPVDQAGTAHKLHAATTPFGQESHERELAVLGCFAAKDMGWRITKVLKFCAHNNHANLKSISA